MKILAAALKGAAQSGLDNTKIQRLHVVDILSNENLLANFMRYRDIEKRVVELEVKYTRLQGKRLRAMRPSKFLYSWFKPQESSAPQIQPLLTQASFLESLAMIIMLGS